MARAVIFSTLLLFSSQEKKEYEFKWGLDKNLAADYTVSDWKGGKPIPRKDKFFIIYGTELKEDGGNSLVVNGYEDLGYHFLFILPKGKVKAGSKWLLEETIYQDARQALTPMHAFGERWVKGEYHFKKVEKVQDRECALIEGAFQFWEVKYDTKGKKSFGPQAVGSISTVQWVSLENTILIRGAYALGGKGQEFKGIKQGEEPKQFKLDKGEYLDLKKDFIKCELQENMEGIHKAIKQGVAWLKTQQEKNGSYVDKGGSFARDFPVGSTALCIMAMLHSGVKADDPVVRAGFAYVMSRPLVKTYEVAATLMLLETKYLPLEKIQDIQELTEEKAKESIQKALTPEDKAYVQKATDWLLEKQTKEGTWGYPESSEHMDHSNTQYALLGLKSAARMGMKIKPEVWKKIANHWIGTQRLTGQAKAALVLKFLSDKDAGISETKAEEKFEQGPWGYFVSKPAGAEVTDQGYGSMTCAGLTSLIIAESELFAQKEIDDTLRKRIDLAKKQGLTWLQEHYSVRGAPPSAGFWSVFYMYYLYSLERVGVLYGISQFNGHDWYLEGALLLVRYQHEDGSWASFDEIPVLDTAFALLFLKKATMRVATK